MATYDRSAGPKEGKSSISGTTRKRIFGGERGIGSINDWLNQGGAGGPVRTDGGKGIDINTQKVPGLQTPTQPQSDITNQLFNPQQMLGNMFNPQAPGGGQQSPEQQTQNLKMLIDWMREQQAADLRRPDIAFQAAARAEDPVRYAQEQQTARLATDPWGPGGQFAGRRAQDLYTPEAIIASGGNTAENQIARLGGRKGVNPDEMARWDEIYRNSRRSYF
jgi:hypothetical protein